jgi:hypothetical protein
MTQIGFHFQAPVNGWKTAVAKLNPGTWVKVFQVQMAKEIKEVNPGVKVVFRYWDDPNQIFTSDWDANVLASVDFYRRWLDGTFMEYAQYLDAFEGWNEFVSNGHTPDERFQRIQSVKAKIHVWDVEYAWKPQLSHLRGVFANTAVGNDIPVEIAREVYNHNHILGYHPYIAFYGTTQAPSEQEWYWSSGRHLEWMDAEYRANGIYVDWLGTEFGACRDINGKGQFQPNDGWNHPDVFGGSNVAKTADLYLNYWSEREARWNSIHNNRSLGAVIFTSNPNDGGWRGFNLQQPQLDEFADLFAAWVPSGGPVVLPPPLEWTKTEKEIWTDSIATQKISLNANAALQRAIFADDMVPVGTEVYMDCSDGSKYAYHAAESLDGTTKRTVYYCEVGKWNDVLKITGD